MCAVFSGWSTWPITQKSKDEASHIPLCRISNNFVSIYSIQSWQPQPRANRTLKCCWIFVWNHLAFFSLALSPCCGSSLVHFEQMWSSLSLSGCSLSIALLLLLKARALPVGFAPGHWYTGLTGDVKLLVFGHVSFLNDPQMSDKCQLFPAWYSDLITLLNNWRWILLSEDLGSYAW